MITTSLFNHGEYELNSGKIVDFKIDCDYLSYDDIESLAKKIASKFTFWHVLGIPTGGNRLEQALYKHCTDDNKNLLLIDDVITTGNTMNIYRDKYKGEYNKILGVVIFSRMNPIELPYWITPLFNSTFYD